ncbi:MAG: hypothetical protein KY428_07575, partial [Bacteroidetes bacterium]|nr:hypothetical protein [Bacteroidota bacterium]
VSLSALRRLKPVDRGRSGRVVRRPAQQPDDDDGAGQGTIREPFFIRDNSGALVANSIFMNYQNAATIEYRADITSSYHRFEAGELMITNNLFYNIGGVTSEASFANAFAISNENGTAPAAGVTSFKEYMTSNNTLADPGFGSGTDKFVPSAEAATTNLATGLSEWGLEDLGYKGAIDPSGTPFYNGWSKTSQLVQQP